MTGKIFRGIISVAVLVMLLCSAFLIGILHECFTDLVFDEIKNEAYFISSGIEVSGDRYLEHISSSANRITVVSTDGSVVFDSRNDPSAMDNHAMREEIQKAFETGEGASSRYSDTIGMDTLYYAVKMSDGRVVRVAADVNSVWTLVLGAVQPMIFVLLLAVIAALLLSKAISKRIVKPINSIDLNNPELDEPYEELAPLVRKIRSQNKRINQQMRELKRKQTEFGIITENMSEGFLIIDTNTDILSYNPSALKLLGVSQDDASKNKSVLSFNRSESFRTAVELALSGKHNEQPLSAGDMRYHIVANPVFHGGSVTGVIIIILDVTEKEKREQLRREFTSNVSHELKTPLTTIYGIADMLCGGIVKPEDIGSFSQTIRSESERMITLINDIIKLSRLDEGCDDIEKCDVDLLDTAKSVSERLKYSAEKAKVTLSVQGESAVIKGAPAIIEEMLYNLADNAIKYNRENGDVLIKVGETDGKKFFSVEDTGTGIPQEAQERVFERFYRVDKSHSRKIGGTGLGLSIVKHGAAFHGASVRLESAENVGTKIEVIF